MIRATHTLKQTDAISVAIGMEEDKRAAVARALSGLLASGYLLYLKTLYYHWNVTGPNFVGLHSLFETQYQEMQPALDALAERVRALGHFTPGTVKEFLVLTQIEDDAYLPASATEMVESLLAAHEVCSREARSGLKTAEEAQDEVTMDMMVERMAYHDSAAWMLRSILE